MIFSTAHLSYHLHGRALIEDISLRFSPGVLYGILGPNGSGKSTLLKTMTGIWTPTSGNVIWGGGDFLSLPRLAKSRILSLVSQAPPIHFDFYVEDIVAMGCYPRQIHSSDEIGRKVKEALGKVDAWFLRGRLLSQLSGGERQRVYIARALATEAPVLLLDEPASFLDLRHQLEMWELLKVLVEMGRCVIAVVHDLVAAREFCDRLVILNHGRCHASGTYPEIMTPDLLRDVFGVGLLRKRSKIGIDIDQFTLLQDNENDCNRGNPFHKENPRAP